MKKLVLNVKNRTVSVDVDASTLSKSDYNGIEFFVNDFDVFLPIAGTGKQVRQTEEGQIFVRYVI